MDQWAAELWDSALMARDQVAFKWMSTHGVGYLLHAKLLRNLLVDHLLTILAKHILCLCSNGLLLTSDHACLLLFLKLSSVFWFNRCLHLCTLTDV